MLTRTLEQSLRDRRGGQLSFLLLGGEGRPASDRLAVTWVEGSPGSEQPLHRHEHNEQAYVIVQGRGLMTVGDERQEVSRGTLILIPPGEAHSVWNIGEEPLVYVSASVPPLESPAGRGAERP